MLFPIACPSLAFPVLNDGAEWRTMARSDWQMSTRQTDRQTCLDRQRERDKKRKEAVPEGTSCKELNYKKSRLHVAVESRSQWDEQYD